MRTKLFTLVAVISAFCLIFVACSDNPADNNLTEGDPQDPNFQMAQSVTEGVVDSLFRFAQTTSNYIDFNGSEPMQAQDSLAIVFDYETCWWYIYLSADTTDGSMVFVDSLRFEDSEGCQQYPDSQTTTTIEYRAFIDIDITSDSGTVAATATENLYLAGIQEDTCVFDVSAASNLELASSLYELSYDYSGNFTHIKFLTEELMNDDNPRPVSGSLFLDLTIYGSYQQSSGSWNWNVTVTFNETGYHARAESGENYWEWDVTYVT